MGPEHVCAAWHCKAASRFAFSRSARDGPPSADLQHPEQGALLRMIATMDDGLSNCACISSHSPPYSPVSIAGAAVWHQLSRMANAAHSWVWHKALHALPCSTDLIWPALQLCQAAAAGTSTKCARRTHQCDQQPPQDNSIPPKHVDALPVCVCIAKQRCSPLQGHIREGVAPGCCPVDC